MFASGKTAAVASAANYIEDVFSTYLYTGNGSTQTITNNIDLAGKGGLTWIKERGAANYHRLFDTSRGPLYTLYSDLTNASTSIANSLTSFNSNGFSLGSGAGQNADTSTYASWTFRKQPKFFDVVTWTGDDAANRQISHSLGSVPGCIIVKRTDTSATWRVWHQNMVSNPANLYQYQLNLNTTNAVNLTYGEVWGTSNNVTSTTFQVGSLAAVNASGGTYVAYVFAHNAGGFGLTGTDNVISCGSYTEGAAGTEQTINLGYEAQWILIKPASISGSWYIYDVMRGFSQTLDAYLLANSANAEATTTSYLFKPASTGFIAPGDLFTPGTNVIYIAIRRGPMKVPTSGTSVFNIVSRTGTGAAATVTGVGFPVDLVFAKNQSQTTFYWDWLDRLRGPDRNLFSNATDAEYSNATVAYQSLTSFANMDGVVLGADGWNAYINGASNPYTNYFMRRAPSFFDEVCYTGTGSALTVNHNLTVAPEIIIIKRRSSAASNNNWYCGWNMNASTYMEAILNTSDAGTLYNYPNWFTSAPTSTTFAIAGGGNVNANTATYVAYLFATCEGVSKVGSYTGTGTTKQVDCGFTGGARFVLIKRTDSTGDWYVWDTARGIVSGNDPYLLLNSTAAETTGTDYIDPYSAGFEISSTAPAAINASGGTFIFLAIA